MFRHVTMHRAVPGALLLCAAGALADEPSPNWFRAPAVSPDGLTIVFTHAGDLYAVPVEGGRAAPLTLSDADETAPVWSPDGRMLAFASDRHGNYDVFVMPAGGGRAKRLTHHSADDIPSDFVPGGKSVVFTSARLDDVEAALFPSGVLAELYQVKLTGGTPTMLLTTPAINAVYDDRGDRMVYEDRKGYEDPLRKHHESSIARDVWLHDLRTGEHAKLTDFPGEDRDPHFAADGKSIVYLSERNGDQNIFRRPIAGGAPRQLTSFEHHPVRALTAADDGTMAFSWHGDIYTLPAEGGRPRRVPITIAVDPRVAVQGKTERSGAVEFDVSPSGKEIAFVLRGEIFVTSTDFPTTKRITTTPEQERSVKFSPDGRTLVYAGERGGSWNIYEASLADDDELYFFAATDIDEQELVATDAEEFQPVFSPDGDKIAYLHDRSVIRVLDLESGKSVPVVDAAAYYSYQDGDYDFAWSPDARWIALHFYDKDVAFISEIGLVPADGSNTDPVNLTESGHAEWVPEWSPDGEAVLWFSTKYGETTLGSWGGEFDVVAAFLTQDAFDRFTLSKEEYTLQKELEAHRASTNDEGAAADDPDPGADADPDQDDPEPPVEFELSDLGDRTLRLTRHSSDLADFAMAPDGRKLYYLAAFEGGHDLWVHDFDEESTKLLAKLGAPQADFFGSLEGGAPQMQLSDDGDSIFLLAGGGLSKIDAQSGERKTIAFAAELDVDHHAERAYMFDHVWRQVEDKFYDPDLHGVDWDFYREQYEPKLAGLHSSRQMAELLSELLGELNASHTGGRYRGGGPGNDQTASLGAFYDNDWRGRGVRIVEIMQGGPLDDADLGVEPGMLITHIDAVEITQGVNVFALLEGKAGDRTRLTIEPSDGPAFDRVVKPISLGAEGRLRYHRWVEQRRAIVEEASGGRLGYAHIRGMNDAAFREFFADVLGRNAGKDGLVVDTRFNGGGWLTDDLVTFLSGNAYSTLHPRQDAAGDMNLAQPGKRWTKPSIVVMSESNYSDAHIFPWAYTENQVGPTVGMPVPGTGTAVWWETLHTGDITFGIPQVGVKDAQGRYLENLQLEPDHKVPLDPASAAAGRDTQLLAAVEILLDMIDEP